MLFGFIRSDFGLDTSKVPATMVVAVGGENFILVHDAKKVRMETKSTRIKIHEIKDAAELDKEISRLRFLGVEMGNSVPRKLIEFLVGVFAYFTEKDGKLFRITASSGGFAEVYAVDVDTKASLKLNVSILQKQEFSVDFRFPHALDTSGQRHRLSTHAAARAAAWLEEVNIIFRPQLNIHFKLAGPPTEPFFNQQIVGVTSSHWDLLKEKANPEAKTITVYLAKSIQTSDKSHPWGISLNKKSRVILLQDRTSEDELVKTLAHEFGHTLGDMKGTPVGHPGEKGDLMVSLSRFDGVRIAGELISVLGKQ
ncbi:MAG TPA: hypothetical protein VM510_13630 [Caulifigura sp.]|jgi:hypothetical protein|nr:hypothetical protein [Caulifigura sp.]